jgi:hypothetical protein
MLFKFFAAGAGIASFASHATAQQIIIQDIFTSGSQYGVPIDAQGASFTGLAPCPINLPGGPWQHITGNANDSKEFSGTLRGVNAEEYADTDYMSDMASFYNTAIGIGLGAYNTGSLHISVRERYVMQPHATLPQGGDVFMLAGFSSVLNSGSNYGPSPLSTFTGLAVTGTAGSLQEYVHGSPVGSPVAFRGTYSAYAPTMLSYTINTSTGAISDAQFGESKADYSFPVPKSFSPSYTSATELGGSAGKGYVAVSSFILQSVAPAKDAPQANAAPAGPGK